MFINCSCLKSIRDGLVWMVAGLSSVFKISPSTLKSKADVYKLLQFEEYS